MDATRRALETALTVTVRRLRESRTVGDADQEFVLDGVLNNLLDQWVVDYLRREVKA